MIPILLATPGTEVTVQMVKGNDDTRAFIQKVGLAPGAVARVVSSNNGDLIVYVKDVRIALTKDMAKRIMV